MADPTPPLPATGGPYQNPINGQPSSVPGSPGLGGALKDLLQALFMSAAPRSIVQRPKVLGQQEAQATGSPGLGGEF